MGVLTTGDGPGAGEVTRTGGLWPPQKCNFNHIKSKNHINFNHIKSKMHTTHYILLDVFLKADSKAKIHFEICPSDPKL